MVGHFDMAKMAKPVTRRAHKVYVRPRGVDTQVKKETNAVLSLPRAGSSQTYSLNGFVEGLESAGCRSQPSDCVEPFCGHSVCGEGPAHGIIQLPAVGRSPCPRGWVGELLGEEEVVLCRKAPRHHARPTVARRVEPSLPLCLCCRGSMPRKLLERPGSRALQSIPLVQRATPGKGYCLGGSREVTERPC